MTKLNSNGGDDKVDELLKERYDLAIARCMEIVGEDAVSEKYNCKAGFSGFLSEYGGFFGENSSHTGKR